MISYTPASQLTLTGFEHPLERALDAKNGQSEPLKTEFFEPLKKSFQTML